MDDGAFDQNFTWYEWGFVSPSEIPSEDLTVPTVPGRQSPQYDSGVVTSWPPVFTSPEDHRWRT